MAAGYGLQLALTGLQLVVTRHAQEGAADNVDLQAVLECARHAPNSMARTAALTLLAQLASVLPRSTLEHVVEVYTAPLDTPLHAFDSKKPNKKKNRFQPYTAHSMTHIHPQHCSMYQTSMCRMRTSRTAPAM